MYRFQSRKLHFVKVGRQWQACIVAGVILLAPLARMAPANGELAALTLESKETTSGLSAAIESYITLCSIGSTEAEIHRSVPSQIPAGPARQSVLKAYLLVQTWGYRSPDAHRQLCKALADEGMGDAAGAACLEGVRAAPHDLELRQDLAQVLYANGSLGDAVQQFHAVADLSPDDPGVLDGVSHGLFRAGEYRAAEEYARKVLDLAPEDVDAYMWLGAILEFQEDWHGAIQVYEDALHVDPGNNGMLRLLATARESVSTRIVVRTTSHEYSIKSIRAAENALALDPASGEAHINLAKAYYHAGRLGDAVPAFIEGLTLEPSHVDGHYWFGRLRGDQGRVEEAIAHYEAAIASGSKNPFVYRFLGLSLLEFGDQEGAMQAFELGLATAALSPREYRDALGTLNIDLAQTLYKNGDYAGAWHRTQIAYDNGYDLIPEPEFVRHLRKLHMAE